MIGCAFRGVLGKSARAENCQAEPNGHGGRRKAGPPAKAGLGGIKKKTPCRIDVRQTCHPFPPSISGGSVAMLGPRERGRQSQDDANVKRENSCRHFRQAKGRAFRMHCNIVRMNWSCGTLSLSSRSHFRSRALVHRGIRRTHLLRRRLTRHLSYQGPSLSSKPRACQTCNRGGGFLYLI